MKDVKVVKDVFTIGFYLFLYLSFSTDSGSDNEYYLIRIRILLTCDQLWNMPMELYSEERYISSYTYPGRIVFRKVDS